MMVLVTDVDEADNGSSWSVTSLGAKSASEKMSLFTG